MCLLPTCFLVRWKVSLDGTELMVTATFWPPSLLRGAPPESFPSPWCWNHQAQAMICIICSFSFAEAMEVEVTMFCGVLSAANWRIWSPLCDRHPNAFLILNPHQPLAPHHSCENSPQCGPIWWFVPLLCQSFSKIKFQRVCKTHL